MTTDRLPLFLALARDWQAAADTLRSCGVEECDPVLRVWREAAWCHLLFARGRYCAALASLRAVVGRVSGVAPDPVPLPSESEPAAVSAAAELFGRLRRAVLARHPRAFGPPAAA
jgi:hypothetical protein